MTQPRVRAVILAAGTGSRFGGAKLAARIGGTPILRHVIDAARAPGLERPVVVLGPADPPGVHLGGTVVVRNPNPERGLASSLQVGLEAAFTRFPLEAAAPDAVLVLLGDQPLVRSDVIHALARLPLDAQRPLAAVRYAGGGAPHPLRIEASGVHLAERATGDRGLGPVMATAPDLVRWVEVEGDNPDVDRPADLVEAIEADWADRVRRNREQVERFRETRDDADHYAPVAGMFRDDPRRTGDDVLERLLAIARPDDTWLDVGAGAGRFAFPLALAMREVIAVDPSAAMVAALRDGKREHDIDNVRVVAGRWPAAAEQLGGLPAADVSFIANVGHDTEEIGPFVDALDHAARRECVAVMQEHPPAAAAAPFFLAVHGEARSPLPALNDFVDLLAARGTPPHVELLDRPERRWRDRDEILTFLRRQTWVVPGSAGDARLQASLDAALDPDGTFRTPPSRVGIVRWKPAAAGTAIEP